MRVNVDIDTWYPVFIIYEHLDFGNIGKEIEITEDKYKKCKEVEKHFQEIQEWIKEKSGW